MWCMRVFHHILLKYGHENAKKKTWWRNTSVLYILSHQEHSYTSRFFLTICTADATASWSTVEGILQLLWHWVPYIQHTLRVPSTVLQLAVASAVLHHMRPIQPVGESWCVEMSTFSRFNIFNNLKVVTKLPVNWIGLITLNSVDRVWLNG